MPRSRCITSAASLLIFALFVPVARSDAAPQAQADGAQIVRATLRQIQLVHGIVRDSGDTIVLKVDPTILVTAALRGTVTTSHDATVLSALSIAGTSTVVSVDRAFQCAANAPDNCLESGRSVVVSLATPVITSDSATVELAIFKSSKSVTVDSSKTMGRPQGTIHITLRANGESSARAHLRRIDGVWTVIRLQTLAQQ